MSPKTFHLKPLVAGLQVFLATSVTAGTLNYVPPTNQSGALNFYTHCAATELNLNPSAGTLTCRSANQPLAPSCATFGVINTTAGGTVASASISARPGDNLVFTGSCSKAETSRTEPLSYQLLPLDSDVPVATNLREAQFAARVPGDAVVGSLGGFRLRAEHAGALSPILTAVFTVANASASPPSGCAINPSTASWTVGNTSTAFAIANCTGAAYRWFADGAVLAGQTGTTLASGALNSLSAANHTISARICNDANQADSGGASCATATASVSVSAQGNTNTPAPSNCQISASAANPVSPGTSGANITFSLGSTCQGTAQQGSSYTTGYNWSLDNSTSLGTGATSNYTFTNAGTSEITRTVTVNVCNYPIGGGAPACQSPTASYSIRISPASGGGGGGGGSSAPSCTNISGITKTIFREVDFSQNVQYQEGRIVIPSTTAIVLAIKTKDVDSPYLQMGQVWVGSQYADIMHIVLADHPCALYSDTNVFGYATGNSAASVAFSVGNGNPPILQRNKWYYATITPRKYDRTTGTFVASCSRNYDCETDFGTISP